MGVRKIYEESLSFYARDSQKQASLHQTEFFKLMTYLQHPPLRTQQTRQKEQRLLKLSRKMILMQPDQISLNNAMLCLAVVSRAAVANADKDIHLQANQLFFKNIKRVSTLSDRMMLTGRIWNRAAQKQVQQVVRESVKEYDGLSEKNVLFSQQFVRHDFIGTKLAVDMIYHVYPSLPVALQASAIGLAAFLHKGPN